MLKMIIVYDTVKKRNVEINMIDTDEEVRRVSKYYGKKYSDILNDMLFCKYDIQDPCDLVGVDDAEFGFEFFSVNKVSDDE